MKRLVHIPATEVPSHWQRVLLILQPAIAYAPAEFDWQEALVSAEMGLVVYEVDGDYRGAMVLQFVPVPGETVLRIILMAGIPQQDAIEQMPAVLELARQNGATAVEMFARKGFEKWAAPLGFKAIHVVYRAEVV